MSVKRPNPALLDDSTKLEDVNQIIKRQIPAGYNNNLSGLRPTPLHLPNLQPTTQSLLLAAGSLLPGHSHNGLDAQKEELNRQYSIAEKVKPLVPLCKDCGDNNNVIEDVRAGAFICTRCGLDCGRIIIEGAEWRNFGDGADASRVVAEDANFGLEHAVRTDNGKKTKHQQVIARATQHLDTLRNVLQFPDNLFTESRSFIQQYVSAPADIIKSSIKADFLAGAALFLAAKYSRHPISQPQIVAVLQLATSSFNKYLKRMENVRQWVKQKNNQNVLLMDPIDEIINHMNLYGKKFNLAKHSLDAGACIIRTYCESKQQYIATSSNILAGGVIYFLTQLDGTPINQHELARVCETSFDNIRKRALQIYAEREQLVPDGFVEPIELEQMSPPN